MCLSVVLKDRANRHGSNFQCSFCKNKVQSPVEIDIHPPPPRHPKTPYRALRGEIPKK